MNVSAPTTATPGSRSLWTAVLLALATIVIFWPVMTSEFTVLDDPGYVTHNAHVQQGLTPQSVTWAFSVNETDNWNPLTWLSHMLAVDWFGNNPAGHHLFNLLLHTVDVVLLFLVLLRLTGAHWRSAVVAALFAWHPLHVESVAWISQRKDVLSTLFLLLAIRAYAAYVRQLDGPLPPTVFRPIT